MRDSFQVQPGEKRRPRSRRKLDIGLDALDLHAAENLGLLLNLLGLKPPEDSLAGLDGVLIGLRTRDLLQALLAARCRVSTVILLLEDIHWIDSVSEEVLAKLVESDRRRISSADPPYAPAGIRAALARQGRGGDAHAEAARGANQIRRLVQTRLGVEAVPDALIAPGDGEGGRQCAVRRGNSELSRGAGGLRVDAGKADFDAALGAAACRRACRPC